MWVIYWAETGQEIDRVESTIERNQIIEREQDNEYGNRPEYRYEA